MIRTLEKIALKNEGPWGPINEDRNDGKKPKSNGGNTDDLDIDKMIKKAQEALDNFLKGFGGGSNKGSKKSDNQNAPKAKSIFGIIILAVVSLWLATGFYKVDSDENAIVLYLGKFYSITTPGLNYRIPYPFSEVIKKSVIKVNTEEFGSSFKSSGQDSQSQVLMLTGDENIVDIDFQIQWQISDIKDYVFNISDTQIAIQKVAESAMREIIARTPIADALSDGKQKIEQETKILLQEVLDSYGAGVRVVLVQLLRVDPPKQVIDSFRDVQTAKADKEKEINQAEAYRNDVIPRARGEAEKLLQDAQGYRESVIANSVGQTKRFSYVYNEYAKSKVVTKRRIYLETMERVYQDTDKIIIDKNLSKSGVVPYLPLNESKKNNEQKQ